MYKVEKSISSLIKMISFVLNFGVLNRKDKENTCHGLVLCCICILVCVCVLFFGGEEGCMFM